jgi:mercuric ion binding protein
MRIRNIIVVLTLLFAPISSYAEEAIVGINGLVCAFCAQGIKRAFGKMEAVESVEVDMDKKTVFLKFRPGQTVADPEIRKVITDTGFDTTGIERAGL